MTRREAREQAFFLIFEQSFNKVPLSKITSYAAEARDVYLNKFAEKLVYGVNENLDEINDIISKYLIKWKKNRISKVSMSLLRLATYEIIFERMIPLSVSINEAVELAKIYGGKNDFSFVNGVLSSIAKEYNK